MSLELKGKIKVVFEKQTFASGFEKREFVITTEEKFPQDVKFELIKDKADELAPSDVGSEITVHYNIKGNEYNGKYYVSLQAWKIVAGQQAATPQQVPDPEDEDGTLPF